MHYEENTAEFGAVNQRLFFFYIFDFHPAAWDLCHPSVNSYGAVPLRRLFRRLLAIVIVVAGRRKTSDRTPATTKSTTSYNLYLTSSYGKLPTTGDTIVATKDNHLRQPTTTPTTTYDYTGDNLRHLNSCYVHPRQAKTDPRHLATAYDSTYASRSQATLTGVH